MKKYLNYGYKDEIMQEIKETLENLGNNNASLIIFKASDRSKSSKTSIVLHINNKCQHELFNGRMDNYNFIINVQYFLISEYKLENYDIYNHNYQLYEV